MNPLRIGLMISAQTAVVGALAFTVGIIAARAQEATETPVPTDEITDEIDAAVTEYVLASGYTQDGQSVLRFAPESVQVHQGDTVTWLVSGGHNIHFGRPRAGMGFSFSSALQPTIDDGDRFTGGDANSGLLTEQLDPDLEPTTFSLIMDVEPGTYAYRCDLHQGMNGVIEVVADDVEIATPDEVAEQVAAFISGEAIEEFDETLVSSNEDLHTASNAGQQG